MMSNNKILTVSYGTFSCTLEGFDDSFGTMKAIAEYFRDLASDDRYFGAEPPVPDAEMLARIAEKEISRRVNAREHQGKIVLSASDPAPLAPQADTVTHDDAGQIALDEARRAAEAEADAEATRVQSEADARAAEDARMAEEAAKAVAAAERAQAEAEAREQAEAEELAHTESEEHAQAEAAEHDRTAETEAATPRDLAAELPEAEAFFAQSTPLDIDDDTYEDVAEVPVPAASEAPVTVPHSDSIAAKLERIRAVVSQADTSADDEDDYSEDEHAEAVSDNAASAVAQINALVEEEDASAEETPDADAIMGDALADIEAALAADATAQAGDEDEAEDQDDINARHMNDDDDDDISSILAGLDGTFDDDTPATAYQLPNIVADSDDADDTMDADSNIFDADEDTAEAPQDQDADIEDEAPGLRRVARVMKVKRTDLENAIAQGALEEIEEDTGPGTLSDEEEAELLRELAEVEAEATDAAYDDETAGDFDLGDSDDGDSDADAAADSAPDVDVNRLMAQTDAQMDDAEGTQNREAFAHLRAAVAARNADDDLSADDSGAVENEYRSDLAEAVKPRRAVVSGEPRSERPDTTPRPAPLKLVAEQRVDVPAADLRGPVRPRRVASAPLHTATDADSFADYAADLGAVKLPDLLEAAASYMSFVEGRDQFSRPQLMNKVRQVEQDDFSREDGLRSFGQLLRAGKIEKIKGGRFSVTGDIGYRPDTRAAG